MFDFDVLIQRKTFRDVQTLGDLTVYKDRVKPIYDCKTLELEQDKNARRDDCIPVGIYTVIKHFSPKFGECFWIQGVPDRDGILIHPANFFYQLLGCIAVGKGYTDINKDGYLDLTSSRKTMDELLNILPNKFVLKIV
ncbi:MAG: hypothetical protein KC589_03185 [Nanoarchaeota archaeon]|nr:hypothetical protein [Nanoarchaeota archaeon]